MTARTDQEMQEWMDVVDNSIHSAINARVQMELVGISWKYRLYLGLRHGWLAYQKRPATIFRVDERETVLVSFRERSY